MSEINEHAGVTGSDEVEGDLPTNPDENAAETEAASPSEAVASDEAGGNQAGAGDDVVTADADANSADANSADANSADSTGDDSDDGDDTNGDDSDDDDDADDGDDSGSAGNGDGSGNGRSNRMQALDEEGDIAADYLEDLLDIAELDGDIDTYTEGGRAHVSLVTDSNLLVGRDGEVLEALQELSRLAVMTETGKRSRLMLDVAGHRERRRRELTDLANDAVTEVQDSGESVRLAPMNPFERKIVHDVVAEAGLSSESEGEEPQRCVVVMR